MSKKLSDKIKDCKPEELRDHLINLAKRVEKLDRKPLVKVQKVAPNAHLPIYMNKGDAGADLYSTINKDILPNQTVTIPTGIALQIPNGYEGQIRPRSGLAAKGLTIPNSPATIDSGYRGVVMIIFHNNTQKVIEIKKGDRIAQLVITQVSSANFQQADNLSSSDRGTNGLGSTGK